MFTVFPGESGFTDAAGNMLIDGVNNLALVTGTPLPPPTPPVVSYFRGEIIETFDPINQVRVMRKLSWS